MNGERLRILRLSRDMSLYELAVATGTIVSKQMLSRYERGLSTPTPRVIVALAKALGVPVSRLFEEPKVIVEPIAYRKRATLKKSDEHRINSLLKNELENRVRLQELIGISISNLSILKISLKSVEDAEQAAIDIRNKWGLGEAPIMSLVNELETRLIHVIEVDAPTNFDGLSLVAYDDRRRPVAVAAATRRGVSGDRQRMSLAHELGHIVMSPNDNVDEEKAAFRFAGALLAPASAIRREIGEKRNAINLGELVILKQRYRISLQALIFRLKELSIISENHAKDWFIQIRARGWATVEPWPIDREEPTWMKKNLHRAMAEGLIRKDDAKEILGDEFEPSIQGSELHEMMQMTRDERREVLQRSVAESAQEYELDIDWIDATLEETIA